MLMDFYWHDYLAASIAIGSVIVLIILLIIDGYNDYKAGRNTSTWKKPEVRHG